MVGSEKPRSLNTDDERQKRTVLPVLSPMTKSKLQALRMGGPAKATLERKPWVPPPLPRCASEVPARYAKGRKEAQQLRRTLLEETYESLDFHGFGGDVEGLRAFLAHKYGSSMRGWRAAIAPDKLGLGNVMFQDFCQGMKKIGYAGHAMTLWKTLTKGSKKVAMWDFEPDLASMLDECAQGVADCFPKGGALEAWKVFPRKHAGRATFEEFQNFLLDTEERELLQEDNIVDLRRVFEALDMSGRGSISREDWHFLDHWAHVHMGLQLHEDPAVEPEEEQHWSPPPARRAPDPALPEFRAFLERHFGSVGRAWRVALDMKGCGSLTLGELGSGCRGMGWKHPHTVLYDQLCSEGGGLATLRALDPLSAQAVDHFAAVVKAQFGGDMYAFWSACLDPGDSGTAKKSTFISACVADLGMEAQAAKRLFALLDTARTGWIAVTELDFVESFECSLITEPVHPEPLRGGEGETSFMASSSSAPALYHGDSAMSETSSTSSWDSIRDGLWSPVKSTRAMQHRCLAQSTMLKKRWLKDAVLDHCMQQRDKNRETLRSTWREKDEVLYNPHKDVFRTTHGFYIEGIKRIKALNDRDDIMDSASATQP